HLEQIARVVRRLHGPRLAVEDRAAAAERFDDLGLPVEQNHLVRGREALAEQRPERACSDDPDAHGALLSLEPAISRLEGVLQPERRPAAAVQQVALPAEE